MTQSMGHQAQIAFDLAIPFDAGSNRFDFVSHTLGQKESILDTDTVMGTRSHSEERTRFGQEDNSGQITVYMSPENLVYWLPVILGTAAAGTTFSLAETLIPFFILADDVDDVYLYSDCFVNTATITGTSGSNFITLVLDIICKTRAAGQTFPVTVPDIPLTLDARPYVFTDGVLNLQSGAREFSEFELVIDNALNVDYRNSTTPTDIDPGDRIITLNVNVPAIATNSDLINQALVGATGTLTFTNSTVSTLFTFGTLQSPSKDPEVAGKGPVQYDLSMIAKKTGSTAELVVTNDSTP